MFMVSIKANKQRLTVLMLVLVCVFSMTSMLLPHQQEIPIEQAAKIEISLDGKTPEQRLAFLKAYGWKVREEPIEVKEVLIPNPFDDVYQNYNDLQRLQGFDLSRYRGKTLQQYIYRVTNYPGYDADCECIQATLLLYKGMIVGGDIASVELDGFMHGFDMENSV